MLDAVVEIQAFTDGMDSIDFRSDARTVRAVEYDFVVLGEAARNVPEDVKTRYSGLPWPLMIGLRNVVAHQYRRVDPNVLWDTVTNDLSAVAPLLREILEAEQ